MGSRGDPRQDGSVTDQWAEWLLHRRDGDDPARRREVMAFLAPVRDRVLDAAAIGPADTVLDVGCGDGLLGLAALERAGEVVFSDVSPTLLEHCRAAAGGRGRFVRTGLPELAAVADRSVDAVVLRSVVMYVPDKPASFRALHRVLRPGGRLSLFEPVNRFARESPGRLWGYDVAAVPELAAKVARAARSDPDGPILGFDERDLLAGAEAAGFTDLRLSYEASVGRVEGPPFRTLLGIAPNPTSTTYGELLDRVLSPAEKERLLAHLDAHPTRWHRSAVAYLSGRREQ